MQHEREDCSVIQKETDVDILRAALAESVKLQSHYAELLNMHDGGERMVFADTESWLERLRRTET